MLAWMAYANQIKSMVVLSRRNGPKGHIGSIVAVRVEGEACSCSKLSALPRLIFKLDKFPGY